MVNLYKYSQILIPDIEKHPILLPHKMCINHCKEQYSIWSLLWDVVWAV